MSWSKLTGIFHFSDNFLQIWVNWMSCAFLLAPLGTHTSSPLTAWKQSCSCKSCILSFFQSSAHCGAIGDLGEGSVPVQCAELSLPHLRPPGPCSQCQRDSESLDGCLRKCELNKRLGLTHLWSSVSGLVGVCGDGPAHTSPDTPAPQCEAAFPPRGYPRKSVPMSSEDVLLMEQPRLQAKSSV